jgi:signal peptidase I
MADNPLPPGKQSLVTRFRTSDHWAASLARDILWVIGVVGGIALLLFLLCGTWPAIVTIESGSMIPNMNIGDLVVVVQKDRFGDLQTWDDGKKSGYKKFGDYGDVIIYRPNGYTDFFASLGLLPLSEQHPIIHRAMTWTEADEPVPLYINPYRGTATPAGYLPLHVSGTTSSGIGILSASPGAAAANYTPDAKDNILDISGTRYILPAAAVVPGMGYIWPNLTTTTHGGYITKGDNNMPSDEGTLAVKGHLVEPVQKDWVIGKALFTVPYVGLLPLHIGPVIVIVIILMVLHELWLRRKEEQAAETMKKKGTKKQK